MSTTDEYVLSVGDVELTIDLSLGARATRWVVGGLSLLTSHGPGPVESGMYPMAPWAGRLRDNSVPVDGRPVALPPTRDSWALHGTVLASRLELMGSGQTDDHAYVSARATAHQSWPWPMEVDISWDLRPRVLTTTIEVRAIDTAFPAVVGWHPWFARRVSRGGPIEWSIAATARAERGTDHLPTGALLPYDPQDGPFDDAFLVPDGRAHVRWPGALRIDIESDASWVVVYDETDVAVCIEPQSGPPDGLNDGLGQPIAMSAPGRPHRMTATWFMADDPQADPA